MFFHGEIPEPLSWDDSLRICLAGNSHWQAEGRQDVSPHTLRHSFGKHSLDAGVDLVTVSTLLGHQRLETTAIYTTPNGRDLERAVSKLERDQLEPWPPNRDRSRILTF